MPHGAIITDLFHCGNTDRKVPAGKGAINKMHVVKRLFSVAELFYPKKAMSGLFQTCVNYF